MIDILDLRFHPDLSHCDGHTMSMILLEDYGILALFPQRTHSSRQPPLRLQQCLDGFIQAQTRTLA